MSDLPSRRVAGHHDIRMDGIVDLILRAKGSSVLDIGCNRGLVGYEFANNGAALVHGCDIYETGIKTAREIFADLRCVQSKFEIVDLTIPGSFQAAFGSQQYDMVVMLATFHKLKRIMSVHALSELMKDFGRRTLKYFAWRGTSLDEAGNAGEIERLDRDFRDIHLKRIHYSEISEQLGAAAIWQRQ